MAGIGATGSVGAYAAQSDYSKSTKTKKPEVFGTPDKTAGTTGTERRPKRHRPGERLRITAEPSVSRSCRRRLRNTMSS